VWVLRTGTVTEMRMAWFLRKFSSLEIDLEAEESVGGVRGGRRFETSLIGLGPSMIAG